MKKILSLVLMMMAAVAAFAYEPKVECAKVKRNGDIKYFEKTELYNRYGNTVTDEDCVKWIIRKDYTAEQLVNYHYERLELLRNAYISFVEKSVNPKPDEFTKKVCDFNRRYCGVEETYDEHEKNVLLRCAKYKKDAAIIGLVCVTEENFLTLTKEEMLEMFKDFVNKVSENK